MQRFNSPTTRRQFLVMGGLALLAVQILPRTAKASDESDEPLYQPKIDETHLMVGSGQGFIPHRHDLLISLDLLENPPTEGIELRTTKTAFHTHAVELSFEQLQQIAAGHVVELTDSTVGEHFFRIYLPKSELL